MQNQYRPTVRIAPALPIHAVAVADMKQTLVVNLSLKQRFSGHKL